IYLNLQDINALRHTIEEDDTTTSNNSPVDDDLVENYDAEQADNNAWIPTDEMLNFTTTIHKDNLLSKSTRAEILKEQPRNAQIKYEAPHMDKRIWKLMSLQAKETDKLLSKQSLKVIFPNYTPSSEREEIFGDDLNSIIEIENATNKLFNKAVDNRAITTFPTIVFKDREMFFGVATTMGIAQGYIATTRTQCPIKKRANSSDKEFVSPFAKLVSDDRTLWHMHTIKEGYCPEWHITPLLNIFPLDQYYIVPLELSGEIQKLLRKRVIEEIDSNTPYDILILIQSSAEVTKQTESVLQMLENLGFRINMPKSNLVLSQQVEYLGFQINSKEISLTHPYKKLPSLEGSSYHWCGTSIETNDMISNKRQKLSSEKIRMGHPINSILSEYPTTQLVGAIKNHKVIYGHWTQTQRRLHINVLELKAIHYALLSFETIKDQTIMIKSDNMTAVAYLNHQGNQNNSSTLIREIKHTSRLGFKSKTHATRLATEPNDIQLTIGEMETIHNRSLCEQKKHPTPILFLKVPRPVSSCNRCIETGLAQRNAMGKPTMDPYLKNIVQSDTRQSYALHYNSRVEDGTILTQSYSKPKMEDVRLLNIRTKLQAKKFPEKVIKKIQKATNKSSNATIGSSINKWCVWYYERSMDPIQGPLENIIEFLNDMSNQNKAFNMIASYGTAISEIHNHIDGYQVGRHPEITKFMIAIHKINSPPSTPDNGLDIWTAFLTALGTAIRPSNLQRIDLRTLCKSKQGISLEITNPKEVNISIAHGGNKYRTKKIFIDYYNDHDLCPASTMLKLLDRTQKWRNIPELQEHLFLTSTTPHRLATVYTISRWIKHILTQADPAAKTKDIRTILALFAQDAGADMNTLLALGNWSNYSVYQRFYQRDIRSMLE
ncbi:382_t:CDS:2, partial [Gigaspora margarita]